MSNRARDIWNMAAHAGLDVTESWRDSRGRFCIKARAGNGAVSQFSISSGPKDDTKGDMNVASRMRTFARQNAAPGSSTASPSNNAIETVKNTHQSAAPTARSTLTLSVPKAPAAATIEPPTAAQELTMGEFYRLCEWIKANDIAKLVNCATAAAKASSAVGQTISEQTFRHAMEVTGTAEPEVWNPPKKPELVIARQVAALLSGVGEKMTPDFERLLARLEAE